MENIWEISIDRCDLFLTDLEGHIVHISTCNSRDSKILSKGFIRLDEMPKKWNEVSGMHKTFTGLTTIKNVKLFWGKIIPILFSLSNNNPIIWQCSNKHARFYALTFKREAKYKFSIIAGSLAGGKPIYDKNDLTGGSNDEQVVMLELTS